MQQTQLRQALNLIGEGTSRLAHIYSDGRRDATEIAEERRGYEEIQEGLSGGERVELGVTIGIQAIQQGYDAAVPGVPSWNVLARVADYERDPRVQRKRAEEAAGITRLRRRAKKKPASGATERRLMRAEV